MATTAYTFPTLVSQEVQGIKAWVNQDNVKADDTTNYASGIPISDSNAYIARRANLIIDGVVQTTRNKAADNTLGIGFSQSFGGAADLWSATLTPAIINSPDFGFAISVGQNAGGVKTDRSYYIKAAGFGFNIPSDAVINGIQVLIEGDTQVLGGGLQDINLDSMQLKVTYTWAPKIAAKGYAGGYLFAEGEGDRPAPDKRFRHIISDAGGEYIGEWRNVKESPKFQQDINNLHSSMKVTLTQNEKSTDTAIEDILTEDEGELLTEDSEILEAQLAAAIGLGPGTEVEVNNNVQVISYYGKLIELLTEDSEPMFTEDDELMLIQEGAPEGKSIFTGYIPEWELDFGNTENINVDILTHSQELNNIMLETADVARVNGGTNTSPIEYTGLQGFSEEQIWGLCQTFTMAGGTNPVARIRVRARQSATWVASHKSDIPITLTLTNGTTPTVPGTTLATAVAIVSANPDNPDEWQNIDFYFDSTSLTNGTVYEFFLSVPDSASVPGGGYRYPVEFQMGSGYAGGSLYEERGRTSPVWTANNDLVFTVYSPGGATTVTFNSQDPSNIFKQIIDFARTRGARVNYTNETVDNTYTVVSVTFQTNTVAEALVACIKLCPADWFTYYDFGENLAHLHARPEVAEHTFTKGHDVVGLKIKRSILKLINDVYFSGGGTPALFTRTTNQTSINTLKRRGLSKQSDNRVTDQTTATILSQSTIDGSDEPTYSGTLRVINVSVPTEDIHVGSLSGLAGFGSLVDGLLLQNVSVVYGAEAVDITLEVLLPKIQKRVEDIKRNLEAQEQANNPSSPTVT